jgi:hypothetical protein
MMFETKKQYIKYFRKTRANILRRVIETHISLIEKNKIKENIRKCKKLDIFIKHRIQTILMKNMVLAHLYYNINEQTDSNMLYFQNIATVLNKITRYMKFHYIIDSESYPEISAKYINETYINELIPNPQNIKCSHITPVNDIISKYSQLNYCCTNLEFIGFIPKKFYKILNQYRTNNNLTALRLIRLRVSLLAYKFNKRGSSYKNTLYDNADFNYFDLLSEPRLMDLNVEQIY